MEGPRLNFTPPSYRRLGSLLFAVGALALAPQLPAQFAVTNVDYGTTVDSADRVAGNLTFLNQVTNVTYVSSALGTYTVDGASATSVAFRRNTGSGNPNTANVYYQYSSIGSYGTTATVIGQGDSTPTLSEVMLSNDLSQGIRNPFANGSGNENSNIERIDFYFAGGYTVRAGDAIVLFDLENYGDHGDGFRIAAYTSIGTVNGVANAPTAYANSGLLIAPGTMGDPIKTPTGTNARYLLSTTTTGDSLASSQSITTLDTNAGTLGAYDLYLVGIMIRFTDLGLSVGQTIYGYSLMAGDVRASSGSDLVNWNNSSVYLTNTDPNTWGNVDFAGFGGTIARAVPEPQSYGCVLLGTGFVLAALRRRTRYSRIGRF